MKLSYVAPSSKPCKYGNVVEKIAAINCRKAMQKIVTIMTSMSISIGLTNLCIKQIGLLLGKVAPESAIQVGKELFLVGFEIISGTSQFLLMLIFLASMLKCLATNRDGKEMTWCMVGTCVGYAVIKFAPLMTTLIMNLLVSLFV